MKTTFFSLIAFIQLTHFISAQDNHHTQFDRFLLNYNPACAGGLAKTDVGVNYRTQWSSINSPFVSYGLSGSQRLSKGNGNGFLGIGVLLSNTKDGKGKQNALNMNLNLSGHVKLNNLSSIGIGIKSGLLQRTLNNNDLRWGSQFDGTAYNPSIINSEGTFQNNLSKLDIGAGIFYNFDMNQKHLVTDNHELKFNVGFSMDHLNHPNVSFNSQSKDPLPIRYTFHTQSLISIANSDFAIGPFMLFQRQGAAMETIIGSKFRYSLIQSSKFTGNNSSQSITLGSSYRIKDAFLFSLQYDYAYYSLGISYDINTSKLSYFSNLRGAFEISLKLILE